MDYENQVISNLLYWAKFCCDESNAYYDRIYEEDDVATHPPAWLAELTEATNMTEEEGFKSISIDGK